MIIGVTAGAIQGYFGGKIDLFFQRFMEIWSAIPTLYVLIILASVIQPNFWWLLIILLLFSAREHAQAQLATALLESGGRSTSLTAPKSRISSQG